MTALYIVHCVDTEGPLSETLKATFERILSIHGVDFEPSEETLIKLQNNQLDLGEKGKAIAKMVNPKLMNLNKNWQMIETMLDRIQSSASREKLLDTAGNGWRFNWFCMDHSGFTGENPRERDLRPHAIFDFYQERTARRGNEMDLVQWHYHPLPLNGHVNSSGNTYLNSGNIWEILSRKIIERNWFPSAYRPGFHTERPDSHWFLEQWIPFDYANQSVSHHDEDQPDLSSGRYGDWRRAPADWSVYHPHHDDYQIPGHCRRVIARCLNMEARHRVITQDEVDKAFKRAADGQPTILSFTNHDFRDMEPEIEKMRRYISSSAKKFPKTPFYFSDAIHAMQSILELTPEKPELSAEIQPSSINGLHTLHIRAGRHLFGPQPYLALKLKDGRYCWENLDVQSDNHWSFTFDQNHVDMNMVEKIGVAANSASGTAEVITL